MGQCQRLKQCPAQSHESSLPLRSASRRPPSSDNVGGYWFTEGFDTPDLHEAKRLLTELQ
jgi:hypothetical protein